MTDSDETERLQLSSCFRNYFESFYGHVPKVVICRSSNAQRRQKTVMSYANSKSPDQHSNLSIV